MLPTLILKPGKERAVLQRHRWIFSGAIAAYPAEFTNGDLCRVVADNGEFLALAYFHRGLSLAGRILSFEDVPVDLALKQSLQSASSLREEFFRSVTTAYRLVHGEADGLPGLVVDQYADVLVVQVTTLGMEKLRMIWLPLLQKVFSPRAIYEKSVVPSRRLEGLDDQEGWLTGSAEERVEIQENGLRLLVSLSDSQKTGFFLDQREMRSLVREYAARKRVLNCFSYSGGFSVAALAGGAVHADSVDISESALELARKNGELNGFTSEQHGVIPADVFQFLRDAALPYDLVVLDPPAFAKKKSDVAAAMRGYRDINRLVLQKLPPRSLLLTCSCSAHVDENLFQKIIFQASNDAQRFVRVVQKHRLAPDHPINVFHPETEYLKSLFLYIE